VTIYWLIYQGRPGDHRGSFTRPSRKWEGPKSIFQALFAFLLWCASNRPHNLKGQFSWPELEGGLCLHNTNTKKLHGSKTKKKKKTPKVEVAAKQGLFEGQLILLQLTYLFNWKYRLPILVQLRTFGYDYWLM
jgi:hypothetical protein